MKNKSKDEYYIWEKRFLALMAGLIVFWVAAIGATGYLTYLLIKALLKYLGG